MKNTGNSYVLIPATGERLPCEVTADYGYLYTVRLRRDYARCFNFDGERKQLKDEGPRSEPFVNAILVIA